ncbi:MAG TPA: hypothetical protein VF331_07305 [Polyangiales bacterium]
MITYNKRLQLVWREYEAHLGGPGKIDDAVAWGLETGRLTEPRLDPKKKLRRDMKDAVRSEVAADDQGREYRVNASVTFVGDDGIQESLFGNIDSPTTPHEFVVEHFEQRRKDLVFTGYRLKIKVDHYNGAHPDREPHQLILDLTDDVAEREALGIDGGGDKSSMDEDEAQDWAEAAEE